MNIKVKNFGKFFAARKQVGSKIVTKNETKNSCNAIYSSLIFADIIIKIFVYKIWVRKNTPSTESIQSDTKRVSSCWCSQIYLSRNKNGTKEYWLNQLLNYDARITNTRKQVTIPLRNYAWSQTKHITQTVLKK